jgi:hypothetical protein
VPSSEVRTPGGLELWCIGTQGEVEAAQRVLSEHFTVVQRSEKDDRLTGNDSGRIRRYLRLQPRQTARVSPPRESETTLV